MSSEFLRGNSLKKDPHAEPLFQWDGGSIYIPNNGDVMIPKEVC